MAIHTVELTDQNFKSEILDASLPCVVDFWSEGCGPCSTLAPVLEDLAKEFSGRVKIGKADIRANPETAARYDIMGVPTILFLNGRQVRAMFLGSRPRAVLQKQIEDLIAGS